MHGTLLDQRIFEALVARCPPMIHNHFEMVDVQLPVASLPWFLSLYINSMPMVFDDPTSVNRNAAWFGYKTTVTPLKLLQLWIGCWHNGGIIWSIVDCPNPIEI
ncbi:hypothetical protein F5887DRAFT_1090075 [Amanita rubescens]|nr:hypothetical protein F5887DRAFT_1090075 [Amanita rubescens]